MNASAGETIRVAILADVRLHREGLARVLAAREGITVVARAAVTTDGLREVCDAAPQVILLEARDVYKRTIVPQLFALAPQARVVAYGVAGEDDDAIRCAEAGVAGYVPDQANTDEVVSITFSVARGEFACSPRVGALLLRRISHLATAPRDDTAIATLTPRERQIAGLIDDGLSNKEIAARLGVTVSTVKNHVHNLLEKVQARRRIQAAARVRQALAS